MVFILNLVVGIGALGIVLILRYVAEITSAGYGIAASLGFIAGCVLYQLAHKSRYGYWFDPPVITESNGREEACESIPGERAKLP